MDEMLITAIADHVYSGLKGLFLQGYVTGALPIGYRRVERARRPAHQPGTAADDAGSRRGRRPTHPPALRMDPRRHVPGRRLATLGGRRRAVRPPLDAGSHDVPRLPPDAGQPALHRPLGVRPQAERLEQQAATTPVRYSGPRRRSWSSSARTSGSSTTSCSSPSRPGWPGSRPARAARRGKGRSTCGTWSPTASSAAAVTSASTSAGSHGQGMTCKSGDLCPAR